MPLLIGFLALSQITDAFSLSSTRTIDANGKIRRSYRPQGTTIDSIANSGHLLDGGLQRNELIKILRIHRSLVRIPVNAGTVRQRLRYYEVRQPRTMNYTTYLNHHFSKLQTIQEPVREHGTKGGDVFMFWGESSTNNIIGKCHTLNAISAYVGMEDICTDIKAFAFAESHIIHQ